MVFFNKNALKNKIQHYKVQLLKVLGFRRRKVENAKVDEAVLESFPASDPPSHRVREEGPRASH